MGNLGRTVLDTRTGYDDSIVAGADIERLMVGATVDWNLVATLNADVTLPSGRVVKAGRKYLRNGQLLARISAGGATVATQNNTPTGGTKTFSITAGGVTTTTTAIPYNATGATVQAAIRLLSNVNQASTVSGSAGGPYTFAFPAAMGSTTVTSDGTLLTGAGAQPTVTFATTSDGRVGWFGPYDPAASDGRAVLHRGDCGLVDRTVVYGGSQALHTTDDFHLGLITGGHVYKGRVLQAGTGSASLAAGPTQADLEAAMPTLVLVTRAY